MWRDPESPPGISPADEPQAEVTGARAVGRLTLYSFGFKYGPPPANHAFDVSFLTNPAREEQFGLFADVDADMRAFVLSQPAAREFLDAVVPLVSLLVRCDDDTRVAFGCSGGRHRSTIVVEEIARRLRSTGLDVRVVHREEIPS